MIPDKEEILNINIVNGRKQLEVFEDILEELYHYNVIVTQEMMQNIFDTLNNDPNRKH